MAIFDALAMAVAMHARSECHPSRASGMHPLAEPVPSEISLPERRPRPTRHSSRPELEPIEFLREKAARLFAERKLTDAEIARTLKVIEGVVRTWYWRWKQAERPVSRPL